MIKNSKTKNQKIPLGTKTDVCVGDLTKMSTTYSEIKKSQSEVSVGKPKIEKQSLFNSSKIAQLQTERYKKKREKKDVDIEILPKVSKINSVTCQSKPEINKFWSTSKTDQQLDEWETDDYKKKMVNWKRKIM